MDSSHRSPRNGLRRQANTRCGVSRWAAPGGPRRYGALAAIVAVALAGLFANGNWGLKRGVSSSDAVDGHHGQVDAEPIGRRAAATLSVPLLVPLDYNTQVVLVGTLILGMSGGTVGTFLLLRKQALLGDVVSHAALPGVGIAFLVMELSQAGNGKWLPGLLLGAAIASTIAMVVTTLLRRTTRIKDDAALAIVLSVFFGIGIVLLTMVQRLPSGNAAGLGHFIYGKAAAMRVADVQLMALIAALTMSICLLLFKEFRVLAFDERFAAAQGWPVTLLDLLLKSTVVVIAVIGLQSVGLLLVVALIIVPPTAARFWSERLATVMLLSAAFGGGAGVMGVLLSAAYPRVATGATITLCGSGLFVVSLFLGTRRGLFWRWIMLRRLRRKAGEQHLLRAFCELVAGDRGGVSIDELCRGTVTPAQLAKQRSWTSGQLRRALRRAAARGWIRMLDGRYQLTQQGAAAARRVVRNHRLWELYLIQFADTAPAAVDRLADDIEHVLDPELIGLLEEQLAAERDELPESPHQLTPPPPSGKS